MTYPARASSPRSRAFFIERSTMREKASNLVSVTNFCWCCIPTMTNSSLSLCSIREQKLVPSSAFIKNSIFCVDSRRIVQTLLFSIRPCRATVSGRLGVTAMALPFFCDNFCIHSNTGTRKCKPDVITKNAALKEDGVFLMSLDYLREATMVAATCGGTTS